MSSTTKEAFEGEEEEEEEGGKKGGERERGEEDQERVEKMVKIFETTDGESDMESDMEREEEDEEEEEQLQVEKVPVKKKTRAKTRLENGEGSKKERRREKEKEKRRRLIFFFFFTINNNSKYEELLSLAKTEDFSDLEKLKFVYISGMWEGRKERKRAGIDNSYSCSYFSYSYFSIGQDAFDRHIVVIVGQYVVVIAILSIIPIITHDDLPSPFLSLPSPLALSQQTKSTLQN